MSEPMKVLKIIGDIDITADLPEDAIIQTVKLDDYMVTEYPERFDMILCVHVLQTLWAHQVSAVIAKMVGEVKHLGELHIQVPATELAAKSLLKNVTDPLAFYLIWGTTSRPFHCGFTLLWLRAQMEQTGVITRYANSRAIELLFDGKKRRIPEHAVIATVIRD